ncbi:small RNA degrading nuclease 3 [Hibiscus trionum]|uniref:Small RNA degrading nuclease 3 n=1 Tax=Hibiscus trionum TaxID=183268 RepID=A0A9W7GTN5_HIBTR|nr:small RNA degrading nuclease 3 [Hibiscus trionum]
MGQHYSAFDVFNSPPEANRAYENMEGDEEKDSSGLPQKLISFQFGNGKTASLYIRKMAQDHSHREASSNKRAFEGEEKLIKSKKAKESTDSKKQETTKENTNQLDEHLKEMERLKQEVNEKNAKIVLQDKMITNLVKKVDGMKKGLNRKK